jgi:hypothetical protein
MTDREEARSGARRYGSLKSSPGERCCVSFVNTSGTALRVLWINFEGEKVEYASLSPGRSFEVNTFATHPWILEDDSGAPFALYVGKSLP